MRLSEIEKRILEIKKILSDSDREKFIQASTYQALNVFGGPTVLEQENRPLIEEKEALETERRFILDRRENLFWRTIWSGVIPVIASIATVLILNHFGLKP